MWPVVSKMIQNSKLDLLHIGRLQQNQAIARGISKILGGDKNFSACSKLSWPSGFHGENVFMESMGDLVTY